IPDIPDALQFRFMYKTATLLHTPGFHDYEALLGRRYAEYYVSMYPATPRPGDARTVSIEFQRRLFDAAAIRYVLISPSVDTLPGVGLSAVPMPGSALHVYQNDTALPRARYVPRVEMVRDPGALLQRLAHGSDDLATVAFVEEPPPSGFTGS